MHCCATGYTSLIWQQYDETKSKWRDFVVRFNESHIERPDNQTLVIQSYLQERDEGRYRCVVSKKNAHSIINTVSLNSTPCLQFDSKPKELLPIRRYYKRLPGESISLQCKGFMGICGNIQDARARRRCRKAKRVTWYKKEKQPEKPLYRYISINKTESSRVYQMSENTTERDEFQQDFLSRTLYINNIQESDYGTYECQLSNRKGTTEVNITLAEGREDLPKDKPDWTPTIIILAGSALAVVLLGFVSFVYHHFRYDIKVFFREKYPRRPQDGLQYDVFLLYNDDSETDSEFVRTTVYPYLRDKCGYSVYRAEMDFPIPSVRAECYVQAVDMCRAVVLVMSPDMISHEWCEFAFHYAITRAKRDMIFLVYRPIPPDFWDDHQRALKAANRMGKTVRWPRNRSSRNLARFWAQLRYYLPVASSASSGYALVT